MKLKQRQSNKLECLLIFLLIIFVVLAMVTGKPVAKVKLPAILGWLIIGIIIGPYTFGWMSNDIIKLEIDSFSP